MKTLILGIGNPLRSDDGVGPWIADLLAAQAAPDQHIASVQQLLPEHIEWFREYDRVLLVDVSENPTPVTIREIRPNDETGFVSSHHVDPRFLANLSNIIYKKWPALFLCEVHGENFDLGQDFSSVMKKNAAQAVQTIQNFLKGV